MGPAPIAWSEIAAYAALMRWPVEPWEAETLRALDDAYLETLTTDGADDV